MDNLRISMNNVWLSQLFKNDGKVLDTYVPHRIRNNKDYKFGFVCFSTALKAMKRNSSLEIMRRKLLINKAKVQNKPTKPMQQYEKKMKCQQAKIWKLAPLVNRSYKEVVDSPPLEEVEVTVDIPLERVLDYPMCDILEMVLLCTNQV